MFIPPGAIIAHTLDTLRGMHLNGGSLKDLTEQDLKRSEWVQYIKGLKPYRDVCLLMIAEHSGESAQTSLDDFLEPQEAINRARRLLKSDEKYQSIYSRFCQNFGVSPHLLPEPPVQQKQEEAPKPEEKPSRSLTTSFSPAPPPPLPAQKMAINPHTVIKAVLGEWNAERSKNLNPDDLKSISDQRDIALPRDTAIYLLYRLADAKSDTERCKFVKDCLDIKDDSTITKALTEVSQSLRVQDRLVQNMIFAASRAAKLKAETISTLVKGVELTPPSMSEPR
jgi:hypothetical protein